MKGIAYLIQALLVLSWWTALQLNQTFYDAFQFTGFSKQSFNALMLPDLVIIALFSAINSYIQSKDLEYVILGGFGFATLYCLNATILTNSGYLPSTVMLLGLAYNLFLIKKNDLFQESKNKNTLVTLVKTIVQIICTWVIALALIPLIIIDGFNFSLPSFYEFNFVGIMFFVPFSILGLYSAYLMVMEGKGTPLPTDQAKVLVKNGPYKIVRNPMAISGVGQAIGISIMVGSIHILIYALLGAFLWNFVVRPLEERDLEKRFGKDFLLYKNNVNCWLPNFKT